MPAGFLRKHRLALMRHRAIGDTNPVELLPWSTGLCDIWADQELLYMSSHCMCGVLCLACLPARTFVNVVNEDPNVWNPALRNASQPVRGACGVKFRTPGQACCWNALLLSVVPCLRCPWRLAARQKYFVEGSILGDVAASTLCFFCAALQEAREVHIEQDPVFTALARVDGATLPNHMVLQGRNTKPKGQEGAQRTRPEADVVSVSNATPA